MCILIVQRLEVFLSYHQLDVMTILKLIKLRKNVHTAERGSVSRLLFHI